MILIIWNPDTLNYIIVMHPILSSLYYILIQLERIHKLNFVYADFKLFISKKN